MSTGLIEIMKRAAIEAVDTGQPCDLRFGTVTSVSPLKVQITNQFTIPESLLIVPRHLTDYEVIVSFEWESELDGKHKHGYSGTTQNAGSHNHSYSGSTGNSSGGSGESAFSSHGHSYSGTTGTESNHAHDYSGTTVESIEHTHIIKSQKDTDTEKKMIIHEALKVGEKVALIRKTGGQVYYILDRI